MYRYVTIHVGTNWSGKNVRETVDLMAVDVPGTVLI